MARRVVLVLFAAAALATAGIAWFAWRADASALPMPPLPTMPPIPYQPTAADRIAAAASNVLPADYVGPKACEDCHAERFTQWSAHPHSRMNQNVSAKTVMGDFNDARITLPKGDVVFSHAGDAFTMTLARAGKTVRRYRVTRTVGSRFMQFYIGNQIEGPEPADAPIYHEEQKLPYGYLFRSKRWLPQNYFDALGPEINRDGSAAYEPFDAPIVHMWKTSCMQCHNTVPYEYRLAFVPPRQGFPTRDIAVNKPALRTALAATNPTAKASPRVIMNQLDIVPDRDLVTLGVSCEACHFGGRAHIASSGETETWLPVSDLFAMKPPATGPEAHRDASNAYVVNGICTQCHSAQAQTFPNGAGVANSREALDLAAGACNPAIKCTDCHDPHVAGGPAGQPASAKQLGACLHCHDKYRDPRAAAAHSKHANKAGVTCLDCHMPRISQGLDQIVRSHRISSPSDPQMLGVEQPNACNLCHLDKSMNWTVGHLQSDWGSKVTIAPRPALDLAAGRAWLTAPSPFTRLAATQAWGRSPLGRTATADLIRALEDPHAVDRVFAAFAVEAVLGAPLTLDDYDPTATLETRTKQIAHLLARVSTAGTSARPAAPPNGGAVPSTAP